MEFLKKLFRKDESDAEFLLSIMVDEIESLREEIRTKDEIIAAKDAKLKRAEKRIERLLWELKLSDEVLNITTEGRKNEHIN